jgi:hypothetical protein
MKFIAHRGNVRGPNVNSENTVQYIESALAKGFDVELDLWLVNEKYYLGHDSPSTEIDFQWLVELRGQIWLHCKNRQALFSLNKSSEEGDCFNYFWHDSDAYTMTSLGFIWTYPGVIEGANTIINLPELSKRNIYQLKESPAFGVCSDYVGLIRSEFGDNNL